MNALLVPCSSCRRHVRASESSCPFCAAALPFEVRAETVSAGPRRRLGSLAVMAFRATALSAAMTTCGGKVEEPAEGGDASSDAAAGASGAGAGGSPSGSSGTGGSGGRGGSSGTGGSGGRGGFGTGGRAGNPPGDGGPVPIYRATPPG
ncbi:MAG TPA: hypothetical protein VK540_20710 [Polyangiaceae bacterium]|nr:hypothetical protein [Polyangiaceae bacterium]